MPANRHAKRICADAFHTIIPRSITEKELTWGLFLPVILNCPINCCLKCPCPPLWGGWPSVARSREVRYLTVFSCVFLQTKAQKPLLSALRAATFPKGEGKALRAPLLQTTICRQISQTDIHILLHRSPRNCGVITVSAVADAIRQGRWSFRRCPSGLPDGWECCSPAAGHG